ncbi:hypothetical protein DFH06DRAFT_1340639 [Mycena polygramma]|nr:hypothetical protein DFH06DRAFT_1340639 [Mycena polygramma]
MPMVAMPAPALAPVPAFARSRPSPRCYAATRPAFYRARCLALLSLLPPLRAPLRPPADARRALPYRPPRPPMPAPVAGPALARPPLSLSILSPAWRRPLSVRPPYVPLRPLACALMVIPLRVSPLPRRFSRVPLHLVPGNLVCPLQGIFPACCTLQS